MRIHHYVAGRRPTAIMEHRVEEGSARAREVGTAADARPLARVDEPASGLTFCTGFYGVRPGNDRAIRPAAAQTSSWMPSSTTWSGGSRK